MGTRGTASPDPRTLADVRIRAREAVWGDCGSCHSTISYMREFVTQYGFSVSSRLVRCPSLGGFLVYAKVS
eukprot:scaffold18265_cov65-Phaeocystis_antarctica.AAC.2